MEKIKISTYNLQEGQIFGYYTDALGMLEPRVRFRNKSEDPYFLYHFAVIRDKEKQIKKYPMLIELTEDGFFIDLLTGTKFSFVPPKNSRLSPYTTKGTIQYHPFYKLQYDKKIDDLQETPLVVVSDELWMVDDSFKCDYAKTTLTDIPGYTKTIENLHSMAQSRFNKGEKLVTQLTTPVEEAIEETERFIRSKTK